MDYNSEHWDDYWEFRPTNHLAGFTRADLLLLGILLGFLDIMAVATLGYAKDFEGVMISLAVALALTAGTAACFRGVLRWGKPAEQEKDQTVSGQLKQTPRLVQAEEIDVFNVRSKAA